MGVPHLRRHVARAGFGYGAVGYRCRSRRVGHGCAWGRGGAVGCGGVERGRWLLLLRGWWCGPVATQIPVSPPPVTAAVSGIVESELPAVTELARRDACDHVCNRGGRTHPCRLVVRADVGLLSEPLAVGRAVGVVVQVRFMEVGQDHVPDGVRVLVA